MNESEFERTARDAAAGVRARADEIADSDGALAQLLTSEARRWLRMARARRPRPEWTSPHERRGRSPWVPLLIAAASVAAIAGIVLVVRGDSPDTIVSTSEPDAPASDRGRRRARLGPGAHRADEHRRGDDDRAARHHCRAAGRSRRHRVRTSTDQQLTRTVLATYGHGDGPDDLGYESCQECEPLTPFAPIVTDDGTVFVADAYNERWQIFRNGDWTSLPYRPGEVVTATPVVGPDGLIYASVADRLGTWSGMRIVSYDPLTMDLVESYPGGSPAYSTVDLVNGTIEMAGRIRTFDASLGRPTWDVDWQTSLVTLSLSGIQRKFQLPGSWHTSDIEVAALDDGSIVLRVYVLADSGPLDYLLVRLWADGSWATGRIARSPGTTNLDGRFTDTGYVQLEDAIVEYAFPTFAGVDPLAGWTVPTFEAPDLAAVPRLLPQQPVPGVVSTVRTEWADTPNESPGYTQTWVRSGAQGAVDAIAQIETRFEPRLPTDTAAADAEIAGWPRSYFSSHRAVGRDPQLVQRDAIDDGVDERARQIRRAGCRQVVGGGCRWRRMGDALTSRSGSMDAGARGMVVGRRIANHRAADSG